MSGFEEIVTPVHSAVARSNEALAADIDDLVDTTDSASESLAEEVDFSQAREMTPGEPIATKPAAEETPAQAAERRLQEMEREEAIKEKMEELLRKTRAERFKARSDAKALAQSFLLEICGIDRFKHDYKRAGGIIHMVFHTPTDDQVREIGKQMVRDGNAKRSLYMTETQLDSVCYRAAMSLASIEIINPNKEVVVMYRQDDVPASSLESSALECLPTDLEPRRRWQYLTKNVLKTQFLTSQVQAAYDEFELLLAELVLMSNEEPDFFSTES